MREVLRVHDWLTADKIKKQPKQRQAKSSTHLSIFETA